MKVNDKLKKKENQKIDFLTTNREAKSLPAI
jgi:hypothetical protein